MDVREVERRFEVAVAKFSRELARQGMYSEGAGQVRAYEIRNMKFDNVVRSLEGAFERCRNVPTVCITLKLGFCFNKKSFGMLIDDARYIESDYIAIDDIGESLIVAVPIWGCGTVEIALRTIPFVAIQDIHVMYEAKNAVVAA